VATLERAGERAWVIGEVVADARQRITIES
jgi:hypothetical protein